MNNRNYWSKVIFFFYHGTGSVLVIMDMQVEIMYECSSKQQVLPQSASFWWPRATAGSSPVVLHTVVTLTPKVNTVCMCVFTGFITAYVTD